MLDKVTDRLLTEGAREKLRGETSAQVRAIMHRIAGDVLMLNEVVACGRYDFRIKFLRAMRPLPVDEYVANRVFDFFEQKAGGMYAAKVFMDKVEITIETDVEKQRKIDDSWMLTSHSSEAAKRKYGLPSGTGPMKLSDLRGMVKTSDLEVDKIIDQHKL